MPEFILDDSGEVLGQEFADLHPFTQGYIEAMFFTECSSTHYMGEWNDPETQEALREGTAGGQLPSDSGYSDIHPDTLIGIHTECGEFRRNNSRWLSMAYARGYDEKQAGRDFWFTRNHHGVGYWDRRPLASDGLGENLTQAAHGFGEVDCYFGDPDRESPTGYGFVYLS